MSVKEIGDQLAKTAASSGIGSKQLRQLLTLAKTRPIDRLEAIIKYQMSRNVTGFGQLGNALLKILAQYPEDKSFIAEVLTHVCLTTDFYRGEKIRTLQPQIESVVKRTAYNYGFQRIECLTERGLCINVYLNKFYGNPRLLSDQIKEQLYKNVPELHETDFEVWINPRRR